MAASERIWTVVIALIGGGGIAIFSYLKPVIPLCTPGLPQPCRCANNATGEARCAKDGSHFEACGGCGDPETGRGPDGAHGPLVATAGVGGIIPAGRITPDIGRGQAPSLPCGTSSDCNRLGIELSKRGADTHRLADYEAAAAALHSACERDYLPACLNEAGVLVAPSDSMCSLADYPRARRLFERACAANMPKGCVELAKMSWKGQGEPPDLQQAVRYAEKGCDMGVKEGCDVRDALRGGDIEVRGGKSFFRGDPFHACPTK